MTLRSAAVKRLLVILAAVGFVATACGGGGNNNSNTSSGSKGKTSSSGTTGGAALKAKLLAITDLPSGYTKTNESDNNGSKNATTQTTTSNAFCKQLSDAAEKYKTNGEASIDFQRGTPGPTGATFFNEQLEQFTSVSDANAAFDLARKAITDECKDLKQVATGMTGSFNGISFPKSGDETFAAELNAKQTAGAQTIDLKGQLVSIRKGDTIALLFAFGFGSQQLSISEVQGLAKAAAAKI